MARQKLGQHFLTASGTLKKIAVAACGDRAELAVEIGPGRGALTAHLLAHAGRVIALELDTAMVDALRSRWPAEPRLEIRHSDALTADFSSFGPGVLAGNLPYYAATPIVSGYLRGPGLLRQGVFLIQKEVAQRIAAAPGTRDYGYLSVECQFLAVAEYLFTVPPGAFSPPPKVDSAVVRLTPRPPRREVDTRTFLGFVSACFRQKRKTLRNNIAGSSYRGNLDGIDSPDRSFMNRRAEELSVEEFIGLFQKIAPAGRVSASARPPGFLRA